MTLVKKNFLRVFMVILCFFSFLSPVYAQDAETLGDLRAIYNDLLKQQAENDNLTEEAKAEIARKEAAIKQAEADIHKAEEDMEKAEEDIRDSNERIEEMKANASDVLLYLQQMKG